MTLFDINGGEFDFKAHKPAQAFAALGPTESLADGIWHARSSTVSIGTLLHFAEQAGANFDQWKRQIPSLPVAPLGQRKPLHGGVYGPDEALELLNSHYLVGRTDQYVGIFRMEETGALVFTPPDQFKLDLANVFVQIAGSDKRIPGEKFWKEHARRHQRRIVFKPGSPTAPDEFNLWRGFSVVPRKGWQKQRRLLRHILEIICRRDKAKFRYLIQWLAWAVQNPDKHPETVIVLKSRKEGTGKSTLGVVMLKIFGPHGALIDDKERLLNRFNDWLEKVSFVLAEEVLWAGDRRAADKLKSMITGGIIPMERKNGSTWQSPNRLHTIMTTNHDHAVAAGVGNRCYIVYDISDERASDKAWFDPLYRDLDDGGVSEFLHFLQNLRLGGWHTREILKTEEATEQQRMSADSVSQWSRACINADAVVGLTNGLTHDLGTWVPSDDLRAGYAGYCRQHSLHAANEEVFGKACAELFGTRKRATPKRSAGSAVAPVLGSGPRSRPRRPWGYNVPTGKKWQEKLDWRLGIK